MVTNVQNPITFAANHSDLFNKKANADIVKIGVHDEGSNVDHNHHVENSVAVVAYVFILPTIHKLQKAIAVTEKITLATNVKDFYLHATNRKMVNEVINLDKHYFSIEMEIIR